jgi:hypothetical protein
MCHPPTGNLGSENAYSPPGWRVRFQMFQVVRYELKPISRLHLIRVGDHEDLVPTLGESANRPITLRTDTALNRRVLPHETYPHSEQPFDDFPGTAPIDSAEFTG